MTAPTDACASVAAGPTRRTPATATLARMNLGKRHGPAGRTLRRAAAGTVCAALIFALSACEQKSAAPPGETKGARGEIVSTEPLASMDAGQVADYVRQQ